MSYASTNTLIIGNTMPGYHTKKDGTKAKAKSTVSSKSYSSMLSGFKK
jgi:hypothetical protein